MSMANLNRWEAAAGYGVDALGRPSYQNEFSMGASPRDHLANTRIHNELKAAAGREDPQGMMIRELLEQVRRSGRLPGTMDLHLPAGIPGGNASYDIRMTNGVPPAP